MKEIRTFGRTQPNELLAALETDRAAYLDIGTLADFPGALDLFEQHLLSVGRPPQDAETKTMFPEKLANAEELPPRRVLQFFAKPELHVAPEAPKPLLVLGDVAEYVIRTMAQKLVAAAVDRYCLDSETAALVQSTDEWSLNVVQYVSVPGRDGQMSFPTHLDWGLFSLYPCIGADGLEVEVDGEFVSVPGSSDGRMLVYAGSVLNKISGGRVKAARHHVRQKTMGPRTVLLYYVDPPRGMRLPDGRTVGEFIDAKLRKIGQI